MTTEPDQVDDGPKCGAKKHQGDGRCGQTAGWGTDHVGYGPCKLHGGNTPTVRRGAERQRLEAEARELFGQLAPDVEPIDNPLEAYAMFAGRVMAWMELMDSLLDDLRSPRYKGTTAEQIRGEVLLYERSMDRANTVLSAYARLNIDERLARVTEKQIEQVNGALTAALADAGLSEEKQQEVEDGLIRHLRLAAG